MDPFQFGAETRAGQFWPSIIQIFPIIEGYKQQINAFHTIIRDK